LIALRSFRVDIDMVRGAEDQGVLVAHGDQGGGYSVYIEDGSLHLAYNEYGDLKDVNAGRLPAGERLVCLSAEALPTFRWNLTLSVGGAPVARLDAVMMLLGLAPFEGIDVGIDRRSPVHWDVFQRHGAFAYTGDLRSVTYTPGEKPNFDAALLAHATRESTRIYE
jgi:arylsulfatase